MADNYRQLVDKLVRQGVLRTPAIVAAFRKIARRDFVRPQEEVAAYVDAPLPIGEGQTISQPWTVAFMLERLQAGAGDKVLEVGSGSGWSSALLAEVVGDRGKVIALEIRSELCAWGRENVNKYGLIDVGRMEMSCQSGWEGFTQEAPFDRIIAAAAGEEIPEAWRVQLKEAGRIVAPIGSAIVVLDKLAGGRWEEQEYGGFAFVPLARS